MLTCCDLNMRGEKEELKMGYQDTKVTDKRKTVLSVLLGNSSVFSQYQLGRQRNSNPEPFSP